MFSYSLNNYAKGFSYLVTEDASIHKGFNSHGFKSNTDNNIEKSSVTIRKKGVIDSLVKLVQHDKLVHSTKLSFEDLITLIPGIGDTLYASTKYISKISYKGDNQNYLLCLYNQTSPLQIDSHPEISFIGSNYVNRDNNLMYMDIQLSTQTRNQIKSLKGLNYINESYIYMPTIVDDNALLIQPLIASYLILMHYSMYVRYKADKWDEIVDPKISNHSTLIEMSIDNAVKTFITDIHRFITKKNIKIREYNDDNVKLYIESNIREIADKIDKELKNQAILRNRY